MWKSADNRIHICNNVIIQETLLMAVFDEEKDVEGLSHPWIKRLYHNVRWLDDAKTKKAILPCTPLAIVKVGNNEVSLTSGIRTPWSIQCDITIR